MKFQQLQHQFSGHIKNPEQCAAPSHIEDRRMKIYRDLFFNNVEGFVRNAFPVLRAISPDETWLRRVRDFFREHQCRSPYFSEVAEEFLGWLQEERGDHPDDPIFIKELAHYEWVELALSVSDADSEAPACDPNGDLMTGRPILSPLAWPLAYRFPVHRISEDYQPETPPEQPSYLIVYRDRLHEVHFLEVNAVTHRLIELLQQNPQFTGQDAIDGIVRELEHPDPGMVQNFGQQFLNELRARNILLGTAC